MIIVKVATPSGDEDVVLPDHDRFEVRELDRILLAESADDSVEPVVFNPSFWVYARVAA